MSFEIVCDTGDLTRAIDAFSQQYHEDYFRVRNAAKSYFALPLSPASARGLAAPLLAALKSWGAGKRAAPACRPMDVAVQALQLPALQNMLRDLAGSFPYLGVADGRRVLKDGAAFATVTEFDHCLIGTLNALADALMVGNTNVTYPMKALLLVAGLAPAFDSQVKGGLAVAGVAGINKTRYLLPRGACGDARKICVLPFHIAQCVAAARPLLDTAIRSSRYPMLIGEYGRLFDVLLFQQRRRTRQTALVGFSGAGEHRWYDI